MIRSPRQERDWFTELEESEQPAQSVQHGHSEENSSTKTEAEENSESQQENTALREPLERAEARAIRARSFLRWAMWLTLAPYLLGWIAAQVESGGLALAAAAGVVVGPSLGLILGTIGMALVFASWRSQRPIRAAIAAGTPLTPAIRRVRARMWLGLLVGLIVLTFAAAHLVCLGSLGLWLSSLRFPNPSW